MEEITPEELLKDAQENGQEIQNEVTEEEE